MKKYECTFIINPDKEEEADELIDSITSFIKDENGKIEDIDKWGPRKLAYQIDGYKDGFYTVMNFDFDPGKVEIFKNFMQKDSNILRYIIVLKEG
ncbi:MAG: 30S ribosomal protein S6 [candidate division WOR-3 bacterium]|nr:30S ribosomal protein S6 [candidate division WOR-3 bacterium]